MVQVRIWRQGDLVISLSHIKYSLFVSAFAPPYKINARCYGNDRQD